MADTVIHVGDIGTIFGFVITEADDVTVIDISAAIVKKIYFMKPDGTKVNKTGVFTTDGKDGKLEYIGVSGDIDQAGTWQKQGYVEIGTSKYWTYKTTFSVQSNLA